MENKPINEVKFNKLSIKNAKQSEFKKTLLKIQNGKYEVESLTDGNKIVIDKPGKKGPQDFKVNLYDAKTQTSKMLKHEEIYADLEEKSKKDSHGTKEIIKGLYKVCNGNEPDEVLKTISTKQTNGLSVETIYKVYKWIWGQEDCNYYPQAKGRWMSMDGLIEQFEIDKKELDKKEI
ncbi:hypothetical protein FACS1894110_24000 [Spirochaetia bacterium]|nr:hypothetical protein FACS1894110_24000 [Spirochaetia bacterium]